MLALTGVAVRREGMVDGGGMDDSFEGEKVKGLKGFCSTSFLLFLDGEQSEAGSTFSPSKSSKVEESKERLGGEKTEAILEGGAAFAFMSRFDLAK